MRLERWKKLGKRVERGERTGLVWERVRRSLSGIVVTGKGDERGDMVTLWSPKYTTASKYINDRK